MFPEKECPVKEEPSDDEKEFLVKEFPKKEELPEKELSEDVVKQEKSASKDLKDKFSGNTIIILFSEKYFVSCLKSLSFQYFFNLEMVA